MAALLRGVVRSIAVAATAAAPGAASQPIAPLSTSQAFISFAGGGGGLSAVAVVGRGVEGSRTSAIGMASAQCLYGGGLSRQALTTFGGLRHPLSSNAAFLGHCRFSLWPRAVSVSCGVNKIHAAQPKASDSLTVVVDEEAGSSRSYGRDTREIPMPSRIFEDQSPRSRHGRVVRSTGRRNGLDSLKNSGPAARNLNALMENNLRENEVHPGSLAVPFYLSRWLSSSAVLDRFDDNEGSDMDVETYKQIHEISTLGANVPDPVLTFASTGFPPTLMKELEKAGFSSPSAIQAMTWPIASESRDVVAVAKTGSGKTLGYLLPAFLRVEKERASSRRRNPLVLVLAPTRELANQIREETWKFGRSSRISCTCICGGASKGPQLRDLERGVDVIIATPGRLNDLLEMNEVDLGRISYLVLDEADRMLDMGFEPQIRSIVKQMSPRRQTLMYTATWPHEVRRIAKDLLNDPVQVNIGNSDQLSANKNITQRIEVVSRYDKGRRLEEILTKSGSDSKILIFCTTKRMCDELAMILRSKFGALALHGAKSQRERDYVMNQFKTGQTPILVATDVAARGLDIKDIRMVINYDFPTCIEDYVHRIGRTGRAGATGIAHTFFGYEDAKHAVQLIKVLESTGQDVLPDLRQMADRGDSRRGFSSRSGGRNAGYRSQYGSQRGGNDDWKWGQSDRPVANRYNNNRFGDGSDRLGNGNERFGSWNERFKSSGNKFDISNDRFGRGNESVQTASSRLGNENTRMGDRIYDRRDGSGSDKSGGGSLNAKWGLSENSSVNGADSKSSWGKRDESNKRRFEKAGKTWGQNELQSLQDLQPLDRYDGKPKMNPDGSLSLW